MNQKRKSITFNNGQCAHFRWNRQTNDLSVGTLLGMILYNNISSPPINNFLRIFQLPVYSDPQLFDTREYAAGL